tara:strand:- start:174 stop:446 length:273 start_codon:yes stop_codon:yes gene_type:complete
MTTFLKQPAEVLDYTFNLDKWMATGDTVQSATATSTPLGLTTTVTNGTTTSPSVWASGGADGKLYKVTLTVATTDGRIKEFEMNLQVAER